MATCPGLLLARFFQAHLHLGHEQVDSSLHAQRIADLAAALRADWRAAAVVPGHDFFRPAPRSHAPDSLRATTWLAVVIC